ncbi:MAG TPA: succinylglutamate desuccinylase/aspartoacylase family protein [Myxococcota bacterium]|nr:succinylglutamate desuccinylase/aspartoacylase family protein [Myxococcota bacterium]HNH46970.1 succinylglutamate desuccinylase/aspartoacylase family protein [Myxococcota bacterium]
MSTIFSLEAPYLGEHRLECRSFGEGSPSVAIVAGVHGNEITGVHAANLISTRLEAGLSRGSVRLLPCVNAGGAEQGGKRWPVDDADLQDVFPGDPGGWAVQRLADAVMAATEAELCIELASGSERLEEWPHARLSEDQETEDLGLGLAWVGAGPSGLVEAWQAAGRKTLELRAGRAGTLDLGAAQVLADAVCRRLAHLGMLPPLAPVPPPPVAREVVDLRCSRAGYFEPLRRCGEPVRAGDVVGVVRALVGGLPLEEVRALATGRVVALRAYPLVHAQELVARVAL